jgi:hypothetical protein
LGFGGVFIDLVCNTVVSNNAIVNNSNNAVRHRPSVKRKNQRFDNVVKFEFVLKGLASSNSSLTARLEEDIPNYLSYLE